MSCQNCNTPPAPCDGCTGCGNKCHEVVQTYSMVQDFRNAFVTVIDENAVYHVDDVGNPVAVSRTPLFVDNYEPVQGDYRQNVVYDFAGNMAYVFDQFGNYREFALAGPVEEESE